MGCVALRNAGTFFCCLKVCNMHSFDKKNMLTASDLQERIFYPIFEEGDGFMMLFELVPQPPPLEPSPPPTPVRRSRRRTRSSWIIPTPALTPPRRRPRRVTVPDLPFSASFPEQRLDPETLPTLPDSTCRVCLLDYEIDDVVIRLPCLHTYHKHCLEPWLRRNACCPQDQMRLEEYIF